MRLCEINCCFEKFVLVATKVFFPSLELDIKQGFCLGAATKKHKWKSNISFNQEFWDEKSLIFFFPIKELLQETVEVRIFRKKTR